MPADGIVQVPPDSTGKKVDAASMDVGANTVYRQRIVIGDNSATAQFAVVTGGALVVTGTVNISAMPTVTVTGGVAISGTAVCEITRSINLNISAMPAVSIDNTTFSTGVTQIVGAGFIFASASATLAIDGSIAAARITERRGLHVNLRDNTGLEVGVTSRPISVRIEAVSAAASIALAAGAANIGSINNISATVTCVVSGFTPAIMSASHGPRCVTASTSANITLIASPGAGASIYITMLAVSNAGAASSRARIGTSASAATIVMFCASAGGGFVMNFDPPWQLSASEAAICSVKPNTSDALINVNFFVK